MNIQSLLERARHRSGVQSTRALAKRISLNPEAMRRIENGSGLPSDDTMVRISLLAGISAEEGLLLLNMWRSSGAAATVYRQLHQRLSRGIPPDDKTVKRANAA
jgi:transcriptional regulator with XRE-family HTH domain